MARHRFRYTKDFDIEASSPEEARAKLEQACLKHESIVLLEALSSDGFTCLGDAELENISDEDTETFSIIDDVDGHLIIMSCQYRGENFSVVCSAKDAGDKVRIKPLALVLKDSMLDHLVDVNGNNPADFKLDEEG